MVYIKQVIKKTVEKNNCEQLFLLSAVNRLISLVSTRDTMLPPSFTTEDDVEDNLVKMVEQPTSQDGLKVGHKGSRIEGSMTTPPPDVKKEVRIVPDIG